MMPPMRRLLSISSAVSLSLCVVACVLWAISYRIAAFERVDLNRSEAVFGVDEGRLRLEYITPSWREPGERPRAMEMSFWKAEPTAAPAVSYSDDLGAGSRYRMLSFPLWLVGVALSAAPFLHLMARNRTPGFVCPSCGYDLRATPDRCPECGAIATQGSA